MESSNPAFKGLDRAVGASSAPNAAQLQQMYDQPSFAGPHPGGADTFARTRGVTIDDVVAKTAAVLGTAVVAGALTVYFAAYALLIPALIVGLVLSLIVIFKRSTNPALILSYAAAEGVVLGAITGVFEQVYPGIGMQAVIGTLGVFVGMLFVYRSGVIRVTPRFTKMLLGAMVGALALMVFNMLAAWVFHFDTGLRSGGMIAVVFSIACIAIAALSFMLDFDQIDKAVKMGADSKYAWYFAFGLMVTLVWLYLEILRLLSYLRD